MMQSLQTVVTQHSGLRTADWASVPHRPSSISHQAWGWVQREMEFTKRVKECGGGEAVWTQ